MNRIVIVDDHFLLRAGWSYLIDPEEDLEICGAAGSVSEALELIEKTSPDLVITDISLPGRSGLELIKDTKVLHPNLPILAVSMHDESLYGERVLKAGGSGYLMKEAVSEQLIGAIRRVLDGKLYVSPNLAEQFLRVCSDGNSASGFPLARLTDREMEVFDQLGNGKGLEEIAKLLGIRARTVEAHRTNIRRKLDVPNSNAVMRFAVRWKESGQLS